MAGVVEKLIRLVGRAFYHDEAIIVLEALIHEKFMKDDEMGNAVNLQTKQVRKILAELEKEHLVSKEVLNDKAIGGSSSMTYWYIDYRHFVDVIKFRWYKMTTFLKEQEEEETVSQTYRCSNDLCGKEYTALEAQCFIQAGQHEFHCGHCGEALAECDSNNRLDDIKILKKKMNDQMTRQEGLHDGILEVLKRIDQYVEEGHPIPRNLPSENRAAGLGGSSTSFVTNGGVRREGGGGGRGQGNGDQDNQQSFLYPYGAEPQEIVVDINHNIEDMIATESRKRKQTDASISQDAKKQRSLPEFLQGSSISGHLAAKHNEQDIKPQIDPLDLENKTNQLTDQQRREDFEKAYLAELAKHNAKTVKGEQVQVYLDKNNGWDLDENVDLMGSDEDSDIEWEFCEAETNQKTQKNLALIQVGGQHRKLNEISEDDLYQMSEEEFRCCYAIMLA